MEIAVTEATGFLGSYLTTRLLAGGHRVVALVRATSGPAMPRLARALGAAGASPVVLGSLQERLRTVDVRLDRERLGLAHREFRQLAGGLKAIWHCAGQIDLAAPYEDLRDVNVAGTRQVLGLAEAAPPGVRLLHVSTAYVAGARRSGVVGEDELDGAHGFLTGYEKSKYHAEHLVRDWAARGGDRRGTVFRPSVLVTARALPRGAPRHPHATLGTRLALLHARGQQAFERRYGLHAGADGCVTLRFPGCEDAVLNVLPVEYATDAMVHLSAEPQRQPLRTYHVVHPVDTPVAVLLRVMEGMVPWLRTRLVADRSDPHPAERSVESLVGGVCRYTGLTRRYARERLQAADARRGALSPRPLDHRYLLATMRAATVPAPSHNRTQDPAERIADRAPAGRRS